MKHLTEFKLFENLGFKQLTLGNSLFGGYYYHIPYNDIRLIKLAFEKNGLMKSETIDNIIVELYDTIKGLMELYIIFNYDDIFKGYYGIYSKNSMIDFLEFKRKESLKDMGTIKLEDWELAANDYNL